MNTLFDTNIVIHREAVRGINKHIGTLFNWVDNLGYKKYIHPLTVEEINRLKASDNRDAMNIKLENYNILKVVSPLNPRVLAVCTPLDFNDNDRNDTLLINEIYNGRVDILISEDRKIGTKAKLLGIAFTTRQI